MVKNYNYDINNLDKVLVDFLQLNSGVEITSIVLAKSKYRKIMDKHINYGGEIIFGHISINILHYIYKGINETGI
jgi:hypothetical protein